MKIFADLSANRGRPHIQALLVLLRVAQATRGESRSKARRVLSAPFSALYRVFALFVVGVDIPVRTRIEAPLSVHHGIGLVVHGHARLGSGVILRQGVTIGAKTGSTEAPVLEDDVNVGSGAQIIGPIRIGAGAQVGAGAVVISDVPTNARAVGNPARILPPAAA
jgi:serine acetyltransferase